LKQTIGLVVEGPYDEAVIPVLAKRCRPNVQTVTRLCKGTVTGKFRGLLAELNRSHRLEKALVISDADGRDPESVVRSLRIEHRKTYRFKVIPLVIVEELEAWLISDPEALKQVLRVDKEFHSPEKRPDPKAELKKLCIYTPEIARKLAEVIDLKVLAKSCPRFSKFRNAVIGG
jgi:hypothetical protein